GRRQFGDGQDAWRRPTAGEYKARGADRHARTARGRLGRRDRAAARLAAAYGARCLYRPASRRSRGDAKQGRHRPIGVPARSGRNCTRPVTAMAVRQKDVSREALSRLPKLDIRELREEWRRLYKTDASPHLSRELLIRAVAYRMQEVAWGGLRPHPQRQLRQIAMELKQTGAAAKRFRPQFKPGN